MFLIPVNKIKKFDPERYCTVLNEFSSAEFSSAIEMLFAAKSIGDKKLSEGFIRHCLDEYRHFSIFTKIKKNIIFNHKINKKELNFVPHHIYNKGYIYKNHFIFEKKKITDFSIFISANEEIAEKKLINFANHLKKYMPKEYTKIEEILLDEKNHSKYSMKFSKKNNSFFIFNIKFFKEKLLSHTRHLYANNLKNLSLIFYPILILILIIIKPISQILKSKRNVIENNVMDSIDPESVI